jgi:hypothetical protein
MLIASAAAWAPPGAAAAKSQPPDASGGLVVAGAYESCDTTAGHGKDAKPGQSKALEKGFSGGKVSCDQASGRLSSRALAFGGTKRSLTDSSKPTQTEDLTTAVSIWFTAPAAGDWEISTAMTVRGRTGRRLAALWHYRSTSAKRSGSHWQTH